MLTLKTCKITPDPDNILTKQRPKLGVLLVLSINHTLSIWLKIKLTGKFLLNIWLH